MSKTLATRLCTLALTVAFLLASVVVLGGEAGVGDKQSSSDSASDTAAPDIRSQLDAIFGMAEREENGALAKFLALTQTLDLGGASPADAADSALSKTLAPNVDAGDQALLKELEKAADMVREARVHAQTVLGNPDYHPDFYISLLERLKNAGLVHDSVAAEAVDMITAASAEGDKLLDLRDKVMGKLQSEARRGKINPGTRLAWGILRVGMGNSDTRIDPASVKYAARRAEASIVHLGVAMQIQMTGEDLEKQVRASAYGYNFTAGWTVLFQKPLGWMALSAEAMRKAGVDPAANPDWEVMEGPGGLIALAMPGKSDKGGARKAFFQGALRDIATLPLPADAGKMTENFLAAAKALHDGVMGDESIPQPIRQALNPVLMGTYQPVDPRDYFDNAFCRRLIEADYLETFINPLPADRARELAAYRQAIDKIDAGYDEFAVDLGDGRRVVAVARPEVDFSDADGGAPRDMETGELLPRYAWRVESPDDTVFFSPLPARFLYAFSLAEYYHGKHQIRPKGVPYRTEVWHAVLGRIASYNDGDDKAEGRSEDWVAAVTMDSRGRRDTTSGPFGWNFPLHVLQRDDQGDPVLLAVPGGTVRSPNFSGIRDKDERRHAEDAWLDGAARVLATPGELGLIYSQFFRYCSDSPLPEYPTLIGSHYGLSDTHQTVYQSLERRWVGRLIGDCDDLAEFFQVLTTRQGKLSHVMQLPAHAACGYVDKLPGGGYRFVVLQTGPVLQFNDPTLNEVVEDAYRHFDDDGGDTHLTAAAVPILLRFEGEDTRTPFVLSARIYEDPEYSKAMIRVQSYWHLYTFSAAIRDMEAMLKTDREVGNIKELGSLYERVGLYDKSAQLRREELESVKDDPQATLSTLLDIAQLHIQDKNKPLALAALDEMQTVMQGMLDDDDVDAFIRAMSFRSSWAILLSRLGEPAKAWGLIKEDVDASKAQGGRVSDSVLRTLVIMYDKMSLNRPAGGASGDPEQDEAREAVGREIEAGLRRGFFKADDSYNNTISRYFFLGRYAVAKEGREAGLKKLLQDGPYPSGPKNQVSRGRGVTDEDWEWMRIVPQLYLVYGSEMLDRDEYPELYNPDAAKPVLEDVARAVTKGTGLGSDVAGDDDLVTASLVLAFLNHDLDAFGRVMSGVHDKNYSSLYDDAAQVFGTYCGLVPLEDFPAWLEAFHRFFPGRQNYFKAAYRAIDKENYDHAAMIAKATAKFFPDDKLLVDESKYVVEQAVPMLKERKAEREKSGKAAPEPVIKKAARPAA